MKKRFVLNTNIILHDSNCIHQFGHHDISIPITVIEELDRFNKGNHVIIGNGVTPRNSEQIFALNAMLNPEIPLVTISGKADEGMTTAGLDYDTRRWQVVAENEQTDFTAERIDQTISVQGIFKGTQVDNRLKIDTGYFTLFKGLNIGRR